VYTQVFSLAHQGLKVNAVEVEVDTGRGLPGMVIVGLPDKSIMESRDRVKAALTHAQMPVPRSRVTVNLAPGDLKKEGPLYDLPIALGIMICTEFLKPKIDPKNFRTVGELSLNGKLRGVKGILNFALHTKSEGKSLILPASNYHEARYVESLELVPISDLDELLNFFKGDITAQELRKNCQEKLPNKTKQPMITKDYSEVKGQMGAKRAMTIAAAGGHNILLIGPPGSGKSMLSERFSGILPKMDQDEALDVTRIYSISGLLDPDHPIITERPFRAPHHTISEIALIGGGCKL
jgi:magnesium chelatase family protein